MLKFIGVLIILGIIYFLIRAVLSNSEIELSVVINGEKIIDYKKDGSSSCRDE